jgi:hypothetical protein
VSWTPCLLTGAWISVFKYLLHNWKRNDAFNYVLTLVHSLAFEVLNLQNGETVWIKCPVISRGSFCTVFFEGRGVGRVIAWAQEHGPQFCIVQLRVFNLKTICSPRVHSTVHEITLKLSSAGIKFFVMKKWNQLNVICNVARRFEGRGSLLLVRRSLEPSFQCLKAFPIKVG